MFTKHSDHVSNGNTAGMSNQTGHHHIFLLYKGMGKKGCENLYAGLKDGSTWVLDNFKSPRGNRQVAY